MLPRIDFEQVSFGQPEWLWLLLLPALLAMLWVWRFLQRRADMRHLAARRMLPIAERFGQAGDLPFWLCLSAAIACLLLALARPHGPAAVMRQGGIDLVILLDGSASMRVKDVSGDRWQRSTRFLRLLADSLAWKSDRISLTLFARVAAPQVRLTTDPNTFFFFLDNLAEEPPFRLAEETTWDTNLEKGIDWGIRMVEKDEELHGRSSNAQLFVAITDGEFWSGEVAEALKRAIDRRIPVFVIGVGTLGGGRMPAFVAPEGEDVEPDADIPLFSRLDRAVLQKIALAGGGQYFELGREGDRQIANAIVDTGKRLAPSLGITEEAEELYWRFLAAAAFFAGAGALFLRERSELWIQLTGVTLALVWLGTILG
jgi:Ca-activated chloride channel family protein